MGLDVELRDHVLAFLKEPYNFEWERRFKVPSSRRCRTPFFAGAVCVRATGRRAALRRAAMRSDKRRCHGIASVEREQRRADLRFLLHQACVLMHTRVDLSAA
jgi:hypothetical protein